MKLIASASCLLLFKQFVTDYHRVYNTTTEYQHRQQIFCDNYNYIESVNSRNGLEYKLAINKYADWTNDEFKLNPKSEGDDDPSLSPSEKIVQNIKFDTTEYDYTQIPDSWDWRDHGHVSKVKDQGKCGSCWSFSTTGVVESHLSIHKNISVLLSEQELVDCSTMISNHGCRGGNVNFAFMYIQTAGLSTEETYPYLAIDDTCHADRIFSGNRHYISDWRNIYHFNETRMLETLYYRGPISVDIAASSKDFKFYKSGVLSTCDYDLDHDVLIVGFGIDETGEKYFTIKNSWASSFGESGYIRIKRGGNDTRGVCGINMMGRFPIVV